MDVIGQFYDLTTSLQTRGVITPYAWEYGRVLCDRNVVESLWIMRGFLISAGHGSGALGYPQLWYTITLLASWGVTRRRLVLSYRGFEDNLLVLSSGVKQSKKIWN